MTDERNRTDVAVGFARNCATCHRLIAQEYWAGPFAFCSPMCRDTSVKLRDYEQSKSAEGRLPQSCPECGRPLTWDHPWECEKWRAAMAPIVETMETERIDGVRNGRCDLGKGCFVCSGAMRERKGGGESNG